MSVAAYRLEKLKRERDEACAKVKQLRCEIDTNDKYMWKHHWAEAIKQRDEALAELELLNEKLDAELNSSVTLQSQRDEARAEVEKVKGEFSKLSADYYNGLRGCSEGGRKLTQLEEKVSELSTQLVDAREYVQSERSHLRAVRDVLLAHKVQYSENSDIAEWVEALAFQRDAHRSEEERIKECCEQGDKMLQQVKKERDEARSEVGQLRATVAAYEQATVNQQLTVRPEPSRLDIAARLLAHGWADRSVEQDSQLTGWALAAADKLIAAAKEAK